MIGFLDLREVTDTLTTGLLAANLLGRQHVLQHAKRRDITVPIAETGEGVDAFQGQEFKLTKTQRFLPQEALDFFRNSLRLPMRTIEKLVDTSTERSAAATKELLDQVREFIDGELQSAIEQGTGVDKFANNVQAILERAGLAPANPFRLETIFRTNMKTFVTAGRVAQVQHPDVRDTFRWWQYNAVMDGAARPEHAAMNGKVYPVDHPIWDTWMPPNGFNCRCSVTPVSQEDIADEGLSVSRVPPKVGGNPAKPDKGFRRNNASALRRNPTTGIG